MSFTMILKQRRRLFQKAVKLNLEKILQDMNLKYGSYNEAYVMQLEKAIGKTFVFFNPERIGRGIIFDATNIGHKGEVLLRLMLPTTPAEIKDFFTIVKAIKEQYGRVEYNINGEKWEEEKVFHLEEEMLDTSLTALRTFFQNEKEQLPTQTLAMFPYTFSKEQRIQFANAKDLQEYEELLHTVQNQDIYYAKPTIYEDKDTAEIIAIYTLTGETKSVFPLDGNRVLLDLDVDHFDKVYIKFILYLKEQALDGLFAYETFINYITKNNPLQKFDEDHVVIPPFSEQEMLAIIEKISE